MPFFENSRDVSVNGGSFTDVHGDWNIYDHSHHIREENSRNTNTTTTTDSNNNSSRHSYARMNVRPEQYPSDAEQYRVRGRTRKAEANVAAQAAMYSKLGHALGSLPMLAYQQQPSAEDFIAPRRGMEAPKILRQADGPSTQIPRQPLSRPLTDPIPTSPNPYVPRYKSNNPFNSHIMNTDPELPSRSSIPRSQNKNDMDVDSDNDDLKTAS